MSRVSLTTAKSALRGADEILLIAPLSLWTGPWAESLGDVPGLAAFVRAAQRGETGVHSVALDSDRPRRALAAILPDEVSRHLSPSRSEILWNQLGAASLSFDAKKGVILGLDDAAHYAPLVTALLRRLPPISLRSTAKPAGALSIGALDADGKALRAPKDLAGRVAGQRWAQRAVDLPPADMDTAIFVREARKLVKGLTGVTSSEIKGQKLLEAKLGGLHAVGRAAETAPRLLVLEYKPKKKARRTVALVGKGIIYDTGGLSLKGKTGMPGMKSDMGGAAAVVGAFHALAAAAGPDRVFAVLALAENAINERAVRNDDVITMHSGHTVEINNTDAEGRLVLGDAVSWVARKHQPDLIVDAATLTGAQLMATGKAHAAVVSNRAGLDARAVAAGLAAGDTVHPLPFAPELYQAEFTSTVADMRNSVADRSNAQASCAGQFIYAHIDDLDIPWLHVDLAGPAFRNRFGTGFGVGLLAQVTQDLQASDLKD
jgi:probable aminopeptidase NPEPL1